MLIKSLKDHLHTQSHTQIKGKVRQKGIEGESCTSSMAFLSCQWNQQRHTSENIVFFRSHANLSFIHRSLRLLSPCLCSPTGGVAPHSPKTLQQPPPLPATRLSPMSLMWGCCQISQEGLGAVCLLCKLERRERERERPEREGVHGT